ncbi:MAG TPA: phage baseplate assembly protein V [Chthonomonadales bacterium]|nr:phage baseplate assembly protein V [Chthonomonadales bacterium]
MPEHDLYTLMGGKENTGEIRDTWMIAQEAIVAVNEDPENQHRIKVVIPAIDENKICNKWVKRLVWWAGAPGYGDFHIPEIGSEVVLFGRLGQKHNLYYISVFNEDFIVPSDFRKPDTRGFRTDGDYKAIVELDYQIRAGRLLIETDASARIIAPGGLYINGKRVG